MMRRNLATVAMAMALTSVPAMAETPAHEAQAREIYARIVGFRTAAGQKQTPAMVFYLTDVLTRAGVPASDITTLDSGEARAMLVRVPDGNAAGR